jgi:uncharacterized membrane protein
VAEIAYMRAVVSMGMLTVVAALAPVALDHYDVSGHQVWAVSSVVVLIGWFVWLIANARTPEYRASFAAEIDADRSRPRWLALVGNTAFLVYVVAMLLGPIAIVLGPRPELDASLYVTVVLLILFGAGWSLLALVYSQRRPTDV